MFHASLSSRHLNIIRRKTLVFHKQGGMKLFWNAHPWISRYRHVNRGSQSTLFLKIVWGRKPDIGYGFNSSRRASSLGWFGVFSVALHLVSHLTQCTWLVVSITSWWSQTKMWVDDRAITLVAQRRGGGESWRGFGPACSPFCLLLLSLLAGLFVYRWVLPSPTHHGLIGT